MALRPQQVVDYRGLTVAQDTELRKKLRESRRWLQSIQEYNDPFCSKGHSIRGSGAESEGPTALAVSKTDATAPARIACLSLPRQLRH